MRSPSQPMLPFSCFQWQKFRIYNIRLETHLNSVLIRISLFCLSCIRQTSSNQTEHILNYWVMPKEEKKAGKEAIPDLRFLGIKIKTPNKTPKINATTAITISQVQPLRLLKKRKEKKRPTFNYNAVFHS